MDRLDFSVVIPVYNESQNISVLYERIKKTINDLSKDHEIIFVDDGSTDNSFELLKNITMQDKHVKVISFNKNYGQHKAVTAGILEACGDYIVTMDADLQNPPEEINKLFQKIKEGFDMVAGYRKMRKDAFMRRVTSFITNFVIFCINGLRMKDYGSMLRIFRKDTAKNLVLEYLKSEGYITMFIAKITRNVSEIEVCHDERRQGSSKYNIKKLLDLFYRIIFYYHHGILRFVKKESQYPYIIKKKAMDGKEIFIFNMA